MRPIDADALLEAIKTDVMGGLNYQRFIREAPTIEPKQGEWIYCEDENGQDGYKCSECGFFVPWYYNYEDIEYIKKYHICPNCGAKTRGREE